MNNLSNHWPARHWQIDPDRPDPRAIRALADVVRLGGVALFPTSFMYGLAADAANPAAVERIFEIKGRSRDKPILVLISQIDQVEELAADVPDTARRLMDRFWPGRLTLVLWAGPLVCPELTAGTGKIGIRMCAHPVCAALTKEAGRPITGTSANISGEPGCRRPLDLPQAMRNRLDLILDAGPLPGGPGSTVLDATTDPPRILRQGTASETAIFDAINQ